MLLEGRREVLQADRQALVWILVDVRGVPWRCGELSVVGEQRKAEGLGECDIHGVVGGEIVTHLECPGLQWPHRVADNPQAGIPATGQCNSV